MAMKDLGKKQKDLYDSPATPETQKNKIVYPELDFPLSFVEGMGLKVDDNVRLIIDARTSGVQDTKWTQRVTFEARQGEVKKSGKKGNNVLAEA